MHQCEENIFFPSFYLFHKTYHIGELIKLHKRLTTSSREDSTHGYHQMDDTKIRLIIFSAVKDAEASYSQQKQDWELMWLGSWTPYCQIQTEIEESGEN